MLQAIVDPMLAMFMMSMTSCIELLFAHASMKRRSKSFSFGLGLNLIGSLTPVLQQLCTGSQVRMGADDR